MSTTSIISLNQLINWFQLFQQNHYFLKDFGFGEPYDIGTSRQMTFPYMWVTMNEDSSIATGSNNKSAIPDLSFSIMFMDKINIQENYLDTNGFPSDNSQEILSDTLQCLQDLVTMIQQNWGQYGVLISQDISFYPAVDETPDKATGVVGRFVLRTRQVNCIIPENPYFLTPTPTVTPTSTPTPTPTNTPTPTPTPIIPTLTFTDFTGNAGFGANYTYTNRSIGGPGLIVFTTHSEGSNNATLSGLTCNGIPATIHETEIIGLSGNYITNSIASVRITSGSTADITVSYTNQMDRMGIGIFRIENNLSDIPISFNSVSANSGTTLSMDLTGLTTNTNLGVVCETVSDWNATNTFYTGATRNYAAKVSLNIGMLITGGNFTSTTAGSQTIFTDTPLSTQSMLLTGVVWN